VIAGAAAVVVVKATSGPAPGGHADARVVMIDAAAAPVATVADAAPVVVAVDAAPDPHAGMTKLPAGTYEIGVAKGVVADALSPRKVTIHDVWIDNTEMTLAALRAALPTLPAETAAKTAADAPTSPARFVDWATASAACKALGKRLPTEAEWEIAARTTPQDPTKARLRRANTEADLVAAATDCSAAGLCDMLGGLREWTTGDWPKKRGHKVIRGASYRTPADGQLDSIHARIPIEASAIDNEIGFRCARPEP
jgi:formylglycine-generating enzyme required for sulfatase activity